MVDRESAERKRRFPGEKGYAVMLAVMVLGVVTISSAAMHSSAFNEVWNARRQVAETKARLSAIAAVEHVLLRLDQGKGVPFNVSRKVDPARYDCQVRRAVGKDVEAALDCLPASLRPAEAGSLVELSITGKAEHGAETYQARVLVDTGTTPKRILLWMKEPPQSKGD